MTGTLRQMCTLCSPAAVCSYLYISVFTAAWCPPMSTRPVQCVSWSHCVHTAQTQTPMFRPSFKCTHPNPTTQMFPRWRVEVTKYTQLYTDKCSPYRVRNDVLFDQFLCITPRPCTQPHAVLEGFISISGETLLRKERYKLIMNEGNSPHITIYIYIYIRSAEQHFTSVALVSVLGNSSSQGGPMNWFLVPFCSKCVSDPAFFYWLVWALLAFLFS